MPEKETLERARRDKRRGKPPSTQAGEFVREEMHHVREGKHGARSRKQAIAIGLSKARRSGVELQPPAGEGRRKSRRTRGAAKKASGSKRRTRGRTRTGRRTTGVRKASSRTSAKRSRASLRALKREPKAV